MNNMSISPDSYMKAQEDKLSELFRELIFSNAKIKDLIEENKRLKEQLNLSKDVGDNEGNR